MDDISMIPEITLTPYFENIHSEKSGRLLTLFHKLYVTLSKWTNTKNYLYGNRIPTWVKKSLSLREIIAIKSRTNL